MKSIIMNIRGGGVSGIREGRNEKKRENAVPKCSKSI